jgi:hypothetical protein
MKKTLCLSLVLTLALFLGSNTAFAVKGANFKGTFEAPFIDVGAEQEVQGSEGKLNTNGEYKVEIETGVPNATYQVCINTMNVPAFLQEMTTDEDGELKAKGNILATVIIQYLQAPSFQVRTAPSGTCGGTLVYESGLAIGQ